MVLPRSGRLRSRTPRRKVKSHHDDCPRNRSRVESTSRRSLDHQQRLQDRPGRYREEPGIQHRTRSRSRSRNRRSFEKSRRSRSPSRNKKYESSHDNFQSRYQDMNNAERKSKPDRWGNEFASTSDGFQNVAFINSNRELRFSPISQTFDDSMEFGQQGPNFDPWDNRPPTLQNLGFDSHQLPVNQMKMAKQHVENPGIAVGYVPNSALEGGQFMDTRSIGVIPPNLDVPGQSDMSRLLSETTDAPIIPEFNPETSKLSAYDWIKLIEETAKERDWKKDEKHYVMTSRLASFARQWYLTLGVTHKSWHDLKHGFLKAFPSEVDYVTLLQRMINRVKLDNESISTYFLHKIALLNECEIHGRKAVSCIIGGLPNSKLRSEAKCQNCEDPDQLYAFLRTQNEKPSAPKSTRQKEQKEESKDGKKRSRVAKCYQCGEVGHLAVNCPHRVNKADKNSNGVMRGSLSQKPILSKYFSEVNINGLFFGGYIDQASECTTIRESSFLQLNVPLQKQYRIVRGFAGSPISSIGFIETAICVDRAVVRIKMHVIPDHIQEIPIVIGQSFIEQPGIVVMKDSDKIRFYQRTDNGEANFDF